MSSMKVDFFTGPIIRFRILYVFLVLAHDRCRILQFAVTAHLTAEWTAQQLREAFPWDSAPRYLPRAYVERVIGTIRRECLDHVIVFNEASLRRILSSCLDSYHQTRTHLWLGKDAPQSRPVQRPGSGRIVAIRQVAGLHRRFERRVA
jgi:putative transposase